MLTEDYIQRFLFLSSSGLSRAGLIVLFFSIFNMVASLYGTLLWALDSPGYIFRESNVKVAEYESLRNMDSPYIIQLYLDPNNLQNTEETLAQVVGSELLKPSLNYTLTGEVQRGTPKITTPTRQDDVGARIWLDSEGFSVSPDTLAMYPLSERIDDQVFPTKLIYFGGGSAKWNCTFNIQQHVLTRDSGNYHWEARDRIDNIWASFGAGGGSAAMVQVFTVTKGTRRHTFVESVLRATMLTNPDVPFAAQDVEDLVRRSGTMNEIESNDPHIDQIVGDMMSAQDQNLSYHSGFNTADNGNLTELQRNWGYYSVTNPALGDQFSLIILTTTNITLITSETIDKPPTPFKNCDHVSFQNEAFGGRITQTDCVGRTTNKNNNVFFGQVDTAAVLVAYGLGNGRSGVSSESLDGIVMSWTRNMSARIEGLFIARGYVVSVDPTLVTMSVDKLMIAIFGGQKW
ncbi:hypothetical protein G7Z17_g1567 [Cylindrodendrum hubeiense]|uniref:Uncharacterized protein n=1 Tax=Cylindrodendrum hubeiense TaxID=595255 RepID=A0A9P5HJA3_9HYPO|nr:hypothetical protein G7Z17_g1567 [Cylindrodendrum hubeiense]